MLDSLLGPGRVGQRSRAAALSAITAALLASLLLHLWGVERNLPDGLEPDEDVLLHPAIEIAAHADFNPHWFGYPASTVIYPLGALLHLQQAAFHGGRWTAPNPAVGVSFLAGDFARYARTGRHLSIGYGVASVALAATLAWQCFGPVAAVISALFAAFSPVAIEFAQPLRSDSAGTFYGLLYLGLVLGVLARPSARRQAFAGSVLGLAIASRLVMASTALVLATVQLRLLRDPGRPRREAVRAMLASWLAVPVSFLVATPYMVLAAREALRSFADEAGQQSAHAGIDQLGVLGNLGFYFFAALPQAIGWPQYVLALLAIGALAWTRHAPTALLALYVASFVLGISLLGIHWQRWTVPVLPVLAVLAATTVVRAAEMLGRLLPRWRHAAVAVLVAATIACMAWPAREAIRITRAFAAPSTEVAALDWVIDNIPDGSAIAYELYTAPLDSGRARAKKFKLLAPTSLSDRSLESYQAEGWEYLLVSSQLFGRYTREPRQYVAEVAFYRRLFRVGTVLHKVGPASGRRGPMVTIFRLPPATTQPSVDSHASAAGQSG